MAKKKTANKPVSRRQAENTGIKRNTAHLEAILEFMRHFDEKSAELDAKFTRALADVQADVDERISKIEQTSATCYEKINLEITGVKTELQHINTIRVNGTVGLEQVLKMLYDVTTDLRNEQALKRLVSNYTKSHKVWNFLVHNKKGKLGISVVAGFLFLSLLHSLVELLFGVKFATLYVNPGVWLGALVDIVKKLLGAS
jgi:hypothetical protein